MVETGECFSWIFSSYMCLLPFHFIKTCKLKKVNKSLFSSKRVGGLERV